MHSVRHPIEVGTKDGAKWENRQSNSLRAEDRLPPSAVLSSSTAPEKRDWCSLPERNQPNKAFSRTNLQSGTSPISRIGPKGRASSRGSTANLQRPSRLPNNPSWFQTPDQVRHSEDADQQERRKEPKPRLQHNRQTYQGNNCEKYGRGPSKPQIFRKSSNKSVSCNAPLIFNGYRKPATNNLSSTGNAARDSEKDGEKVYLPSRHATVERASKSHNTPCRTPNGGSANAGAAGAASAANAGAASAANVGAASAANVGAAGAASAANAGAASAANVGAASAANVGAAGAASAANAGATKFVDLTKGWPLSSTAVASTAVATPKDAESTATSHRQLTPSTPSNLTTSVPSLQQSKRKTEDNLSLETPLSIKGARKSRRVRNRPSPVPTLIAANDPNIELSGVSRDNVKNATTKVPKRPKPLSQCIPQCLPQSLPLQLAMQCTPAVAPEQQLETPLTPERLRRGNTAPPLCREPSVAVRPTSLPDLSTDLNRSSAPKVIFSAQEEIRTSTVRAPPDTPSQNNEKRMFEKRMFEEHPRPTPERETSKVLQHKDPLLQPVASWLLQKRSTTQRLKDDTSENHPPKTQLPDYAPALLEVSTGSIETSLPSGGTSTSVSLDSNTSASDEIDRRFMPDVSHNNCETNNHVDGSVDKFRAQNVQCDVCLPRNAIHIKFEGVTGFEKAGTEKAYYPEQRERRNPYLHKLRDSNVMQTNGLNYESERFQRIIPCQVGSPDLSSPADGRQHSLSPVRYHKLPTACWGSAPPGLAKLAAIAYTYGHKNSHNTPPHSSSRTGPQLFVADTKKIDTINYGVIPESKSNESTNLAKLPGPGSLGRIRATEPLESHHYGTGSELKDGIDSSDGPQRLVSFGISSSVEVISEQNVIVAVATVPGLTAFSPDTPTFGTAGGSARSGSPASPHDNLTNSLMPESCNLGSRTISHSNEAAPEVSSVPAPNSLPTSPAPGPGLTVNVSTTMSRYSQPTVSSFPVTDLNSHVFFSRRELAPLHGSFTSGPTSKGGGPVPSATHILPIASCLKSTRSVDISALGSREDLPQSYTTHSHFLIPKEIHLGPGPLERLLNKSDKKHFESEYTAQAKGSPGRTQPPTLPIMRYAHLEETLQQDSGIQNDGKLTEECDRLCWADEHDYQLSELPDQLSDFYDQFENQKGLKPTNLNLASVRSLKEELHNQSREPTTCPGRYCFRGTGEDIAGEMGVPLVNTKDTCLRHQLSLVDLGHLRMVHRRIGQGKSAASRQKFLVSGVKIRNSPLPETTVPAGENVAQQVTQQESTEQNASIVPFNGEHSIGSYQEGQESCQQGCQITAIGASRISSSNSSQAVSTPGTSSEPTPNEVTENFFSPKTSDILVNSAAEPDNNWDDHSNVSGGVPDLICTESETSPVRIQSPSIESASIKSPHNDSSTYIVSGPNDQSHDTFHPPHPIVNYIVASSVTENLFTQTGTELCEDPPFFDSPGSVMKSMVYRAHLNLLHEYIIGKCKELMITRSGFTDLIAALAAQFFICASIGFKLIATWIVAAFLIPAANAVYAMWADLDSIGGLQKRVAAVAGYAGKYKEHFVSLSAYISAVVPVPVFSMKCIQFVETLGLPITSFAKQWTERGRSLAQNILQLAQHQCTRFACLSSTAWSKYVTTGRSEGEQSLFLETLEMCIFLGQFFFDLFHTIGEALYDGFRRAGLSLTDTLKHYSGQFIKCNDQFFSQAENEIGYDSLENEIVHCEERQDSVLYLRGISPYQVHVTNWWGTDTYFEQDGWSIAPQHIDMARSGVSRLMAFFWLAGEIMAKDLWTAVAFLGNRCFIGSQMFGRMILKVSIEKAIILRRAQKSNWFAKDYSSVMRFGKFSASWPRTILECARTGPYRLLRHIRRIATSTNQFNSLAAILRAGDRIKEPKPRIQQLHLPEKIDNNIEYAKEEHRNNTLSPRPAVFGQTLRFDLSPREMAPDRPYSFAQPAKIAVLGSHEIQDNVSYRTVIQRYMWFARLIAGPVVHCLVASYCICVQCLAQVVLFLLVGDTTIVDYPLESESSVPATEIMNWFSSNAPVLRRFVVILSQLPIWAAKFRVLYLRQIFQWYVEIGVQKMAITSAIRDALGNFRNLARQMEGAAKPYVEVVLFSGNVLVKMFEIVMEDLRAAAIDIMDAVKASATWTATQIWSRRPIIHAWIEHMEFRSETYFAAGKRLFWDQFCGTAGTGTDQSQRNLTLACCLYIARYVLNQTRRELARRLRETWAAFITTARELCGRLELQKNTSRVPQLLNTVLKKAALKISSILSSLTHKQRVLASLVGSRVESQRRIWQRKAIRYLLQQLQETECAQSVVPRRSRFHYSNRSVPMNFVLRRRCTYPTKSPRTGVLNFGVAHCKGKIQTSFPLLRPEQRSRSCPSTFISHTGKTEVALTKTSLGTFALSETSMDDLSEHVILKAASVAWQWSGLANSPAFLEQYKPLTHACAQLEPSSLEDATCNACNKRVLAILGAAIVAQTAWRQCASSLTRTAESAPQFSYRLLEEQQNLHAVLRQTDEIFKMLHLCVNEDIRVRHLLTTFFRSL